jgi:hypothetical protein
VDGVPQLLLVDRCQSGDANASSAKQLSLNVLMLVCAFAGLDVRRHAYAHAIEAGYRF